MQQCTAEDLIEVILPDLASSVSVWQYLSACAENTSLSSLVADSPAAIPEDVAMQNVDVAVMLRQYATLHQCVRRFCEDLLEKDAQIAEDHGKVDEQSPEKDSATNSAMPGDQNCSLEDDSVAGIEMSSVPNTSRSENTNGLLTDRIDVSFSEMQQNTDSSAEGNSSARVLSFHLNGDMRDAAVLPRSVDSDSKHVDESHKLNSGELVTSGNPETVNSCTLDGNLNPEIGNSQESNSSVHSETSSEMPETSSILRNAAEKPDDGEVLIADCSKDSCSTVAVNNADHKSVETEPSTVEPSVESSKEDIMVPITTDNTRPLTAVQIPSSADTSDTTRAAVTVIDNTLEVSISLVHDMSY